MADFQAKKIPIFSDVNDVPIAPTANSGGNISHFYDLYNQLVDDLEENINDLENNIATIDEIAGDGFDQAQNLDARVYDYYYYYINPNKNYIIFQRLTLGCRKKLPYCPDKFSDFWYLYC